MRRMDPSGEALRLQARLGEQATGLLVGLGSGTAAQPVVGIDVQETAAVEEALNDHGERYVTHVFTAQEAASAGFPGATGPGTAASLAVRFAAKEAILKILQPPAELPWRDLEVVQAGSGACSVALHGAAQRLAAERGLGSWTLSLSHEAGLAVAIVIALRASARH